jgi:hypothetical protein
MTGSSLAGEERALRSLGGLRCLEGVVDLGAGLVRGTICTWSRLESSLS